MPAVSAFAAWLLNETGVHSLSDILGGQWVGPYPSTWSPYLPYVNTSNFFNCTTGTGGADASLMVPLGDGYYYNSTDDSIYSCATWSWYSSWQIPGVSWSWELVPYNYSYSYNYS